MADYKITLLKGDGIGPEIVDEAVKVLNKTAEKFNFTVEYDYAKIHDIANEAKEVPKEWINESHNWVTAEMLEYLQPLVLGEPKLEYNAGLPVYVTR